MADVQFSHGMGATRSVSAAEEAHQTRAKSLALMANTAGAVVSLALIAGIAVWGYKLVMRDVTGIPIVRAAAGEMRVRPAEPGGMQARHQGLSVNAVAAEGGAEAPADRLVLAPRAAGLAEEDQPISPEMVAAVQQPEALPPVAEAVVDRGDADANDAVATTIPPRTDAVDAIVSDMIAGVVPDGTVPLSSLGDAGTGPVSDAPEEMPDASADLAETEGVDASTEAAIMAAIASVTQDPAPVTVLKGTGVRESLRPRTRPDAGPEMLIQARLEVPATTSEIAADQIPTGTRLAQLGAYESAEVAREEWVKLEGRFTDYLDGKSRVVEKAQSGGRTFYRLRAMGFIDLSDARRFCSALVAENLDCIPVVAR